MKQIVILILLACLLCSVTVVITEETDERECQQAGSFSFSNSDFDEPPEDKKEPQPVLQPALDLPFDRVFYITTLLLCLIVLFSAKKTFNLLCVSYS